LHIGSRALGVCMCERRVWCTYSLRYTYVFCAVPDAANVRQSSATAATPRAEARAAHMARDLSLSRHAAVYLASVCCRARRTWGRLSAARTAHVTQVRGGHRKQCSEAMHGMLHGLATPAAIAVRHWLGGCLVGKGPRNQCVPTNGEVELTRGGPARPQRPQRPQRHRTTPAGAASVVAGRRERPQIINGHRWCRHVRLPLALQPVERLQRG